MRSAADLPDDIDELKRRLIAAEAGLLAKTLEAEKLKFELARLKRMSFGDSSERIEREIEQLEQEPRHGSSRCKHVGELAGKAPVLRARASAHSGRQSMNSKPYRRCK